MSVPHHDAGSISRSLAALGAAIFLIVAWALPGTGSTVVADDAGPPASAPAEPAAEPTVPDSDVPDPTVPDASEPDPTVPDSTESDPTVPDPTEPDPSEPVPDSTQSDPSEPTPDPTEPDPNVPDPSDLTEPDSTVPVAEDRAEADPVGPTTTEPPPPTTVTLEEAPAATVLEETETDGTPTRITFEVVWQQSDGSPMGDLDAALPSGWRGAFVISGEAATGDGVPTSATCAYPASGGGLECTYVNPGHDGGTGLLMPARETATYRVSVAGSPDGWSADGSTVGTFVGFETCPPGTGPCAHVVRMLESSTPAPTTTDPGHDGGHGSGQGNPTRILFEVRWLHLDGSQTTTPDAAALPPGSLDSFLLQGESETGSGRATLATCSYSASGDALECTYVNPGHEDGTGLVVRARASATYDVSVSGAPAGWTVDGSTVGTFVGRDTCPRGEGGGGHSGGGGGGHTDDGHTDGGHTDGGHTDGGHTDDGHTDDGHTDDGHTGGSGGHSGGSGGHSGGGGSGSGNTFVCTHVVVLVQQAAATTTEPATEPATTTTTEPVAGTDTTVAQTPPAASPGTTAVLASGARTLPATGPSSTGLVVIALIITLVGFGLRLSGARHPI